MQREIGTSARSLLAMTFHEVETAPPAEGIRTA